MDTELAKSDAANADGAARIAVSSAAILERWSEHDWVDAVSIAKLSPFDRIVATTRNHTYEIVVGSPEDGTVLVRGGSYFADLTVARVIGSSLGGSTIKLGALAVGFRVELATHDGRLVITTPVEALAVVRGRETGREAARS
jgi:hypothetical protein